MCLCFHELPLEIFTRGEHEHEVAASPAVVIVEKNRVFRLNETASNLGIKPGHSMDTAYTLSHQVVSFERDADKEKNTLSHLAQWAYQFTPNVVVESQDCLLLDITGCLKLFKGLKALISKAEKDLQRMGYRPVITINVTPLAALLIARANAGLEAGTTENSTVVNGTIVNGTIESIGQVSIRFLQIDEKIITSLQQMGINNVKKLLALPGSGLIRRFGLYFVDYLERLTGARPDPQKFISPKANFLHDITFLSDVTNLDSLNFPINRLLGELSEFLSARQLCIDHFTWHLSHRNHGARSFSIYLANPENTPRVFLALTQLKLDQINDIKEVDNIALSAKRFFPVSAASNDLFPGNLCSTSSYQENTSLLNMFRARLGPGRCHGISLSNDHRPEKAWKTVRLNQRDYWFPEQELAVELPRPAFLLSAPRALNVTDNKPYLYGKLELLKGPERIDYGWWDQSINKPLTRDYYVARQKDGNLYWVFQHVSMKRWYLHGIFS